MSADKDGQFEWRLLPMSIDARLRNLESFRAEQIENATAFVKTERMIDAMFIDGIVGRGQAAAMTRLD